MKNSRFTKAALLSLILFLSIATLNVASCNGLSPRSTHWGDPDKSSQFRIGFEWGHIFFRRISHKGSLPAGALEGWQESGEPPDGMFLHAESLTRRAILNKQLLPAIYGQGTEITIPFLWPLIATAILPVLAGIQFLKTLPLTLRRDPSFCRRCSYDLTGNTSGVCPECGTPIS